VTPSDSKSLILDSIKRLGAADMEQLVGRTGLARTTLREHLALLERDALVHRSHKRSGPGRPALQYRLTRLGEERFPSEERELLGDLIRYLENEGKQHLLQAFFEAFWNKRAARACELMQAAAVSNKADPERDGYLPPDLKALSDLLESEGFMPEIHYDETNKSLVIRECNCPFKSVINETSLPCRLETRFYEKVFGQKVSRTAFIPDGDNACSYRIELGNPSVQPADS
jgi:predicted ArsR family transcriptional regulator